MEKNKELYVKTGMTSLFIAQWVFAISYLLLCNNFSLLVNLTWIVFITTVSMWICLVTLSLKNNESSIYSTLAFGLYLISGITSIFNHNHYGWILILVGVIFGYNVSSSVKTSIASRFEHEVRLTSGVAPELNAAEPDRTSLFDVTKKAKFIDELSTRDLVATLLKGVEKPNDKDLSSEKFQLLVDEMASLIDYYNSMSSISSFAPYKGETRGLIIKYAKEIRELTSVSQVKSIEEELADSISLAKKHQTR